MFSYGVTQAKSGIRVYKPGSRDGILVGFAYLKSKIPKPFRAEVSGGAGQVIHDKFVVVDFNGVAPKVFTGSSNLALGGEEANGDNLLELDGPDIASLYAVEAVRQVDHYQFRVAMDSATTAAPLVLKGPNNWHEWVDPYYDPNDIKSVDRGLFAR